MNRFRTLAHSKWECKYHVVWVPKYRRKTLYGEKRQLNLLHQERYVSWSEGDNHFQAQHFSAQMARDQSPCLTSVDYDTLEIRHDDCGQYIRSTYAVKEPGEEQINATPLFITWLRNGVSGFADEPFYNSGEIRVQLNQWIGIIPLFDGRVAPSWYLEASGEESLSCVVGQQCSY